WTEALTFVCWPSPTDAAVRSTGAGAIEPRRCSRLTHELEQVHARNHRARGIRTPVLSVPNRMRYQTALSPAPAAPRALDAPAADRVEADSSDPPRAQEARSPW